MGGNWRMSRGSEGEEGRTARWTFFHLMVGSGSDRFLRVCLFFAFVPTDNEDKDRLIRLDVSRTGVCCASKRQLFMLEAGLVDRRSNVRVLWG